MIETIRPFAEKYHVKIENSGAELLAPGKFGEIADSYHDGDGDMLRLRLMATPRDASMNKALNARFEQAKAAGFKLRKRSGFESIWLFDPRNDAHCRVAIELVRPRMRRQVNLTPEQRAAVGARLAASRDQARVSI